MAYISLEGVMVKIASYVFFKIHPNAVNPVGQCGDPGRKTHTAQVYFKIFRSSVNIQTKAEGYGERRMEMW